MTREKVWHDRNYWMAHEGYIWTLDVAFWRAPDGKDVLRVYAIHGDVSTKATRALNDGLELLSAAKSLEYSLSKAA